MSLCRILVPAAILLATAAMPAAAQTARAPAAPRGDVAAAAAQLQAGDAPGAIARLTAAIGGGKLTGTALGEAYRTRAAAHTAEKDYPSALTDVQQAMLLLPNDAQVYAVRCQILIRRGLVTNASQDAEVALQRDPRNADAYACRGTVDVVTKNYDKAVTDFGEAIRLTPAAASLYSSRGLAQAFRGDYAAAVTDFDQALARGARAPASDRAEWLVNRARARSALRQFDAAVRDAGEAIALDAAIPARQADWYAARGRIQAQGGNVAAGVADFDRALQLAAASEDPIRSPYLEDRARMHALAGNYDLAIKDLDEAIQKRKAILPGQLAEWYSLRARVLAAQGQEVKAIADLDEALRLRAGNAGVLAERGMLKLRRDPAGAQADFTAALAKEPTQVQAQVGQAWLAAERGDFAGAIAAADNVVAGQDGNDLAYQLRGTFRFFAGRYDAAVQDFDAAIQRDPRNTQAPAWRAMTLARAGRPEGAPPGATGWPAPVLALFGQTADPATVEAAAKAADGGRGRAHECEALFYIGEMWLSRGDKGRARTAFERAVATSMVTAPEHAAARYELVLLKRR